MIKQKMYELAQPDKHQLTGNDTASEASNEHKRLDLQLRAVCECDYSIVHAIDEKELLSQICRILCVTARYKLAWVDTVLTGENKSLRPLVWHGADDQVLNKNSTWAENEDGQRPSAIAACTCKTQVVKDLATELAAPWRDAALERGYRSCISLPLLKDGIVLAVLSLYSPVPNSFNHHEVRLLETLVGNIEYAINAIDDRKKREIAEAEKSHLAMLAECSPNPILEFDNYGNVKYANSTARMHFPLTVQGLKKELVLEFINSVRKTEGQTINRDINIGNSWFEQTLTYIPSTQSYLLYGRDVTVRKQYEEKLQQRTFQLESMNAELEAFSYSVSHDLKAPLRSLSGFSAALFEEYGGNLDEIGKLYLRKLKESSDQMARLVDDLLKLARISLSNMVLETVNLSDMAEQIVDELRYSQPDRRVMVTIQPNLVVNGDRILLSRVIENLLSNAWKFSNKVPEPRIELGMVEIEHKQTFFVRDNGAGFDMDYASQLFKPFQRLHTESDFPGTGIGLAIVQRIVRHHGGNVWAESKIGEGATFYFKLA